MTRARELEAYARETEAEEAKDVEDRREKTPPFPPIAHDRLNGAALVLPPCGCNVVGRGTIPYPIRIKFCAGHRKAVIS
jgi:hypothetical protein